MTFLENLISTAEVNGENIILVNFSFIDILFIGDNFNIEEVENDTIFLIVLRRWINLIAGWTIAVKLENFYIDYLNNVWGKEKDKMFRDDNPETLKVTSFTKVYGEISQNSKVTKEENSWVLETKFGENKYKASASVVGEYDPDKQNVIFHHYVGTQSGKELAKYLLGTIPYLRKNFNLIAITAHGHEKQPDNPKRNVMSDTFPTMESLQGTIATSAKLIEQVSRDLEKSSIPVGVSLGGIVVEWNRLLSDNDKTAGRITVEAYPDAAAILLSKPFDKLIDKPKDRRNLMKYRKSFSLEGVPVEAFDRTKNSTVILGSEDKIVDRKKADEYYKKLGIKPLMLPFGHYTLISEGFPSIPKAISRALKEIKEENDS